MCWVEGHISYCSRVLRRCHSERSSCPSEFGCCSFIIRSPWTICFLLVMWNNFCIFMSHDWVEFHFSLLDSVLETEKLQAKVLTSTCRTILVCRIWTLMVWHFWDALRQNTIAKEKIAKMAPGKNFRISNQLCKSKFNLNFLHVVNFFCFKESFPLFVACQIRNIWLRTNLL